MSTITLDARTQRLTSLSKGVITNKARAAMQRDMRERPHIEGVLELSAMLKDPPACVTGLEMLRFLAYPKNAGAKVAQRWMVKARIPYYRHGRQVTVGIDSDAT